MRNFTIYLTALFCLFLTKVFSQETFETRAKSIATNIENITKEEKSALKSEIESVNTELEKGSITKEQADAKKIEFATTRAKNIETRVAQEQDKLNILVKEKVDGKIVENNKTNKHEFTIPVKKDTLASENRLTSQVVFAGGLNNLVTNGSVANSDFAYLKSSFLELGITLKSRLIKDNNFLYLKYGISGMYNKITATDNRYFVENGSQTTLATFPKKLYSTDTHFKNVYVVIPVHLEFDFSKKKIVDGKQILRSQQGFRLGIGGYLGYNTNSKQFLGYYDESGNRVTVREKGNWNVNDWNYGLSTYFGYKDTSLYLKYDLNPLFKNNDVKQNNISLGIRFDFN